MSDQIVKRRRTKRCRSSSLNTPLVTACLSSGGSAIDGSVTLSEDVFESSYLEEEEEEDMANCLILLAQGDGPKKMEKSATLYGYECKTCNRSFPSFQALGGHRASHKKLKPTTGLPLILFSSSYSDDSKLDDWSSPKMAPIRIGSGCSNPTKSPQINTNKSSKLHECPICGSEFNSGQALGGHMRRHRTSNTVVADQESKDQESRKSRILLSLDLNLPAPEDDHLNQLHYSRDTTFQFHQAQQPLVFSVASLVDCHY